MARPCLHALREDGLQVLDADVVTLSVFIRAHIGGDRRYSSTCPTSPTRARPLRGSGADDE
ncbi:hypothetical protein [Nocardia sp. NPDC047648]|uniref:hypothetical protein n=1 Tax=Nocardia sp. NPDC047648 TaxID=3155625 RepID=UPI0033E70426